MSSGPISYGQINSGQMNSGPMSFGQMFSRLFEVLRLRWKLLLGTSVSFAALMMVAVMVCAGPLVWHIFSLPQEEMAKPDFATMGWFFAPLALLYPLMFVWVSLAGGAQAMASIKANRGEPFSVDGALGSAFARGWKYLWLYLLRALLISVPVLLVIGVALGGVAAVIWSMSRGGSDGEAYVALIPIAVLLYLPAMVFVIWASVRLSLVTYLVADLNLSAVEALKRSWQLTKDAFWRIFGLLALVYLLMYVVQFVVTMVLYFFVLIGVLVGIAGHAEENHGLLAVLIGLGAVLFGGLMTVLFGAMQAGYSTVLAIAYDDQTVRQRPVSMPPPLPAVEWKQEEGAG